MSKTNMSEEIQYYLQGDYRWFAVKKRLWGNKRCAIGITKGHLVVGFLAWHPDAKQVTFFSEINCTKPLLDFIMPIMEKKRFYCMVKTAKLLTRQEMESQK